MSRKEIINDIIVRIRVAVAKDYTPEFVAKLRRGLRRYSSLLAQWKKQLEDLWEVHDLIPGAYQRFRARCEEIYTAAMHQVA